MSTNFNIKKRIYVLSVISFFLFYPLQSYGFYLSRDEDVKMIPTESWLTPILSFLTMPIIYLFFLALKNMIIKILNGDNNTNDIELKESTTNQVKNKMIVSFINKVFEALIFVIIILGLAYIQFFNIIEEKVYKIHEDIAVLGGIITFVLIALQDLIKYGIDWYKENSKL